MYTIPMNIQPMRVTVADHLIIERYAGKNGMMKYIPSSTITANILISGMIAEQAVKKMVNHAKK